VVVLVVPPIRHRLGDVKRPEIPLTYPSMFRLHGIGEGYWLTLRLYSPYWSEKTSRWLRRRIAGVLGARMKSRMIDR
jgi:hypothetical protein